MGGLQLYRVDFTNFFEEYNIDVYKFIDMIEDKFPIFLQVVEQMGYNLDVNTDDKEKLKDELIQILQIFKDIYNFGMSGGISGFIYYKETVEFFDNNKDEIMRYHVNCREELGFKNFDEMVSSFTNCGDYIYNELVNGIGLEHLKNDLVWGYIEFYCYRLFDLSLDLNSLQSLENFE